MATDKSDRHWYPHWEKFPKEAKYSDWTIEIVSSESSAPSFPSPPSTKRPSPPSEATATRYAVHRMILGVSSHYFDKVFGGSGTTPFSFVESTQQESKITLPRLAVEAFDDMLEYCYSLGSNKKVVKTTNAAVLLFLSDYFQVDGLHEIVDEFVRSDVDSTNCDMYLQHGRELNIDFLVDRVAVIALSNPDLLCSDGLLSEMADVELWKAVLKNSEVYWHFWDECLVPAFVGFLSTVDKKDFLELTDPELLPRIPGEVVAEILELEHRLNLVEGRHKLEEEGKMTSLQERCLERDWELCWCFVKPETLRGKLRQYSPIFLEELVHSFMQQYSDLDEAADMLGSECCELSKHIDLYDSVLYGTVKSSIPAKTSRYMLNHGPEKFKAQYPNFPVKRTKKSK